MFTSFPNVIDRFSNVDCPDAILFSEERHKLGLASSLEGYFTVYGEISIDHGRFEWAIRINKCGDKQGIIGVATGNALSNVNNSNNDPNGGTGKFSDKLHGFGFGLNGLFRNGGKILNNKNLNKNAAISLHEGDILFMRIDLNTQILSFAKNGILLDIEIKNMPIHSKYRLAISFYDENESYSIVSPSEYLSKFSLYQYKLSVLPLQDRFKYVGKQNKNYLKLLVHNTVVQHIDNPNNNTSQQQSRSKSNIIKDPNDIYIDTAYGSRWITRGIFEWILQIQGDNVDYVHIGIYGHHNMNNNINTNNNNNKLNPFKSHFEQSKYGYGVKNDGYRLRNQSMMKKIISINHGGTGKGYHSRTNSDFNLGTLYDENEKYKYCSGFSLLDLIHVRLDLINKTLSFIRNGEDLGIAYKNVYIAKDFGYRLAVKLKTSRCRISIVSAHPVVCH